MYNKKPPFEITDGRPSVCQPNRPLSRGTRVVPIRATPPPAIR